LKYTYKLLLAFSICPVLEFHLSSTAPNIVSYNNTHFMSPWTFVSSLFQPVIQFYFTLPFVFISNYNFQAKTIVACVEGTLSNRIGCGILHLV